MRFFVFSIFLMLQPLGAALIPMPREVEVGEGEFLVDAQTSVIASSDFAVPGQVLTAALQKTTGYLHRVLTPRQLGRMVLKRSLRLGVVEMEKEEAYRLKITREGVTIDGSDLAGLMHGVQAFVQLLPVANEPLPRVMIPCQTIQDWPETGRRIFHLDVSAHLFPTSDLKKVVDWLSFHKLNEFHLQLNGDSGWRMESLKFPKLHEIGSVRASTPPFGDPMGSDSTEYGGYYPQKNLRELVEYAAVRGIEVVPCFSFETGASALIAAYPELGNAPAKVATTWEERKIGVVQNDATLKFLEDLLTEVTTIFPSKFIRVQGEASEFQEQLRVLLQKKKKELFLAGEMPSTNFSVYSRPAEAELLLSSKLAAEEGFNSLRQVYEMKVGKLSEARLRTRYAREIGKLEYLVFPRLAAFAEATWLPAEMLKYDDFRIRVDDLVSRYRTLGVQSSMPYEEPSGAVMGGAMGGAIVTSSLTGRDLHQPEMIFDGRDESFFWSEGNPTKGDHLTLEFPWPIEGDILVATGRWGEGEGEAPGMLFDGVLDLSADGKEWDAVAEFFNGIVSVTVPAGTKFARIRAFSSQDEPLILHEVTLSEPLLMPQHLESRDIELPLSKEKVTLTFKANFENHPNLREEISMIRRTYFKEWVPIARRLGLNQDWKISRTFEVKSGEPGELSAEEAQRWLLSRLISQIQAYPVTAPLWFETGMKSRLLGDFPEKPDRVKGLEGGAETASFLNWVAEKFGEEVLIGISQDCRSGRYHPDIWKFFTKKKLEELMLEYRQSE